MICPKCGTENLDTLFFCRSCGCRLGAAANDAFAGQPSQRDVNGGVKSSAQDAESLFRKGEAHFHGDGVEQDEEEVAKWLRQAAEQGSPEAQYEYARLCSLGKAVEKDEAEAFKWFMKAAQQGFADAMHQVSVCYLVGLGVKRDLQESDKWLEKAAANGSEVAQEILKTSPEHRREDWMSSKGDKVLVAVLVFVSGFVFLLLACALFTR